MTKIKEPTPRLARPRARASTKAAAPANRGPSAAQRQAMIAESAYYRWVERGLLEGDPVQDWLIAERMIDSAVLPHR